METQDDVEVVPEPRSEIIEANTNKLTLSIAVAALSLVVVAGVAGIIYLSAKGEAVPDVLQNIVFGAIGFLGGHLTKDR